MSDEKKEVKQSSLLLDIIIIIIGAISLMLGIVYYIELYLTSLITMPAWWPFTGPATATFIKILGGGTTLPIGVWVFIGGLGLVREKGWALGVMFVCFTLIIVNGLVGVVTGLIADPMTFILLWANWVAIILVVVAAIGFIYLLATSKRYH